MTDDIVITKEGLEELKAELENRKTNIRTKIADDIAKAREQGDLSENAAYSAAMEAKQFNETRIEEIESIIKNSIVKEANTKDKFAGIGEKISIKRESDSTKLTYTLVGENEADPSEGKISIKSPIGNGVSGKKKGDKFTVKLPSGEERFELVSIN